MAEQLAYGLDGFHIDMLDQGCGPPYGCWCESCEVLFKEGHGRAMPDGVTWDENWDAMMEFRYESSQRFEKALSEHIKALAPKVTVDFNYHGNPPFSWEVGQRPVQHAVQGDFVTGETGVWGFSALTVGLNAEFEARRLFSNAVRMLNPDPLVRIQAAVNVEAVVTEDSSNGLLRVHLLGYHAPPQTTPAENRPYVLPALLEDRPMFRAVIEVAEPFASAEAAGGSIRLTIDGQRIEAVVEDVHEAIGIRRAQAR